MSLTGELPSASVQRVIRDREQARAEARTNPPPPVEAAAPPPPPPPVPAVAHVYTQERHRAVLTVAEGVCVALAGPHGRWLPHEARSATAHLTYPQMAAWGGDVPPWLLFVAGLAILLGGTGVAGRVGDSFRRRSSTSATRPTTTRPATPPPAQPQPQPAPPAPTPGEPSPEDWQRWEEMAT